VIWLLRIFIFARPKKDRHSYGGFKKLPNYTCVVAITQADGKGRTDYSARKSQIPDNNLPERRSSLTELALLCVSADES
jgi:hypothetical protein